MRLCKNNHAPKLCINKKTNEQNYLFYLDSGNYLKKYHDLFYDSYIWVDQTNINGKKLEKIKAFSFDLSVKTDGKGIKEGTNQLPSF